MTPAVPSPPAFAYPRTTDQWLEQAKYVRAVMPEWGPPDELNFRTLARAKGNRVLDNKPQFRDLLATYSDTTFYGMLDQVIEQRNIKSAWRIFQTVWEDAPDSPHIHGWTGWGRLCDLCSEGPAFFRGT